MDRDTRWDLIFNAPVPPILDILGKWVGISNTKTASRSMFRVVLKDRAIFRHRGHRNYVVTANKIIKPNDPFVFTFVRNPWERIVSAFFYMQQQTVRYDVIDKKWEFKDYIKNEFNGPETNIHFHEQYGYDIPGVFVGRFENLQKDWNFVTKKLNIKKELPLLGKTDRHHYAHYYDDECLNIIGRYYKKEIDSLGYEYGV